MGILGKPAYSAIANKALRSKEADLLVGYKLAEKWNSFKLKDLVILSPAFRFYSLPGNGQKENKAGLHLPLLSINDFLWL
jgi:hypothetical protein